MSNKTAAKSLNEIIMGKKFCIPMYQRNYKWNSDVAVKLVQDIISCYDKKNKKTLGLITLHKDKNSEVYDVIDGQQRFTTLAILLAYLTGETKIDLMFQRDDENKKRSLAVSKEIESEYECTDVNRIIRNRNKMIGALKDKYCDNIPKMELADYILENVTMLCSVVNTLPVDEFMNLNAYKTAFSISDHIRANLIVLNSFYKEKLEKDNTPSILARCLSKQSYKTAVAILYNNLQEKLYEEKKGEKGTYKSVYDLLKKPSSIIIDPMNESRINILFGGMLKEGAKNYVSGEIVEEPEYWIKMLQKLAFVNKLLNELKCEFDSGEFHSFKQIDDYQKITKKSFIREVFDGIDNDWDSQTLAKEIQKYSNIDSVVIRCLQPDLNKLANRYLEAFVYSDVNSESFKKADNEDGNKVCLEQMSKDEVIEEISCCGRYIIDRYELEHREDLNINIDIPPVLDLEDRENINFGGSLELKGSDEISVGELLKYNIKIPVIQRDYCMGARITGENDFLSFLLAGYDKYKNGNNDCNLSASTVLLSVSKEKDKEKSLYIFDGQQRTFSLYNILRHCGCEMKDYFFVGRKTEKSEQENHLYGSPYSKEAVKHLEDILQKKIKDEDKDNFAKYIKERVFLKVKIVNNVSGAEQFFMDINGGVALKKYEIYKSMLCSRLSDIGKEDVVRKIENEWLDFFYNYRKKYLKVTNISEDESDEEELLEIRFIEYVCRFIYRMNHYGAMYKDRLKYQESLDVALPEPDISYGNKIEEEVPLLSFDEIESKAEVVANLKYIDNLTECDVQNIETIMDRVIDNQFSQDEDCKHLVDICREEIKISSSSSISIYCMFLKNIYKKDVINNRCKYLNRFIWSLSNTNREYINKYYKYEKYKKDDNISYLIKIYDNDQIIRDILLKSMAPTYDYLVKDDELYIYKIDAGVKVNIYGGYNNGKIPIERLPMKEVPVYYWKDICNIGNNIMRLCYLKDKGMLNDESKELHFALVPANYERSLKYENGDGSNFLQIKEEIEYAEKYNEIDIRFKSNKIWYWMPKKVAEKNAAYIFRYGALRYLISEGKE